MSDRTQPPSKLDMARAIVRRLQRLPALPAADSPMVAEIARNSDAMVRILFDGADPAEAAHGSARHPSAQHSFPAALAVTPKQHCPAGHNAAAYEMVLRLSEAEGDLLRDAIELISTRSYAADYGATIGSLLAKLRIEEMIQAGCRLADVRQDLCRPAPIQARPTDRWSR